MLVLIHAKNILNKLIKQINLNPLCGVTKSEIMPHSLVLHLQDLVHGDDPSAGEVLTVLTHLDGLQPLRHRPEGGTIRATGAGQADGYAASKEKWIQMIIVNRLSHNKGR